jgi:regulator of sigma E protease
VIGRPDFAPVVGHVEGFAAQAQLARGDTLLAVGDRDTPTWSEAALALATAALDRKDVQVHVRTRDDDDAVRTLHLSQLPRDADEQRLMQDIGLTPRHQLLPPVVGRIEPGSAAWGVLADGDRITAIDGTPVPSFDDIGPLVQRLGGRQGMIEVQRDGDRLALEITPRRHDNATGGRYWALGIAPAPAPTPAYDAELRYGPVAAVPAAVRETW